MKRVGWILHRIIGPEEDKMLFNGLKPYKKKDGYYFTKKVIFAFGNK